MNDIFTPQQTKVRKLIKHDLAATTLTQAYLQDLDSELDNKDSVYYLDKPVESKIYIDATVPTTPNDLKRLFEDGKPLPNVKTRYIKKSYSGYSIPFRGILTNNLSTVIANQDFNGEPFLKGKFNYMDVTIPPKNSTARELHRSLPATLNGFKVCTNATLESLVALAKDILRLFPSIKAQINAYAVAKKVFETNTPFIGIPKYVKIIWNPDYAFTGTQKNKIINSYNGKTKRNKTFEILKENFTEGMTQKQLWEKTGTSRSKVKRYWRGLQVGQLEDQQTGFLKVA